VSRQPFSRRHHDLHRGGDRGREPRGMVPAAAARLREHQRTGDAPPPQWQPQPPDRAPPLSRPAQQPVCAARPAGPRPVRAVRPPVHDRLAAPPVRERLETHPAPGAARPHPIRDGRDLRRAGHPRPRGLTRVRAVQASPGPSKPRGCAAGPGLRSAGTGAVNDRVAPPWRGQGRRGRRYATAGRSKWGLGPQTPVPLGSMRATR